MNDFALTCAILFPSLAVVLWSLICLGHFHRRTGLFSLNVNSSDTSVHTVPAHTPDPSSTDTVWSVPYSLSYHPPPASSFRQIRNSKDHASRRPTRRVASVVEREVVRPVSRIIACHPSLDSIHIRLDEAGHTSVAASRYRRVDHGSTKHGIHIYVRNDHHTDEPSPPSTQSMASNTRKQVQNHLPPPERVVEELLRAWETATPQSR